MTKNQLRKIKSHYMARWAIMRHNQKNPNKIIALEDQFVLKNLIVGNTICYNCLGDIYQGIIQMHPGEKYQNLILINNHEFKYQTVDQINQQIRDLADKFLLPGGRIIISVSHKFLIYNRTTISVDTLLDTWFCKEKKLNSIKILNLLGKSNPGYGDYFFCVDYA